MVLPKAKELIIEGDDPEEVIFLYSQSIAWRARYRRKVSRKEMPLDLDFMDSRKSLMTALEGQTIEWV